MLFSVVTRLLFVVFIERRIFSSSCNHRKMVMYNIASNLNGMFRRIGKAT